MRLFDYLFYKLFSLINSIQKRQNDAITPLFLLIIPFALWFLPLLYLVFGDTFYLASIPVIWGLFVGALGWIGYWRYILKGKYKLIFSIVSRGKLLEEFVGLCIDGGVFSYSFASVYEINLLKTFSTYLILFQGLSLRVKR